MARRPKPWFRKGRRAWFVTIDGVQHNLGPEKGEAYERFFDLMRQPKEQKVAVAVEAADRHVVAVAGFRVVQPDRGLDQAEADFANGLPGHWRAFRSGMMELQNRGVGGEPPAPQSLFDKP